MKLIICIFNILIFRDLDLKLSKNQIRELKALHRSCKQRRFADRIKAVLLLNDGFSCCEVGRILLLDDDTIRNYKKKYIELGAQSLLNDNYKGKTGSLTKKQLEKLAEVLSQKIHTSTAQILQKVTELFGVKLKKSRIIEIIKQLGFTYRKPKLIPSKIDVKAQEEFVQKYQELKDNLAPEDQIYFMDGVHPQHNSQPSFGWIKKKNPKDLPSNTGRQRVNINGALNLNNLEVNYLECERINSQTVIEHLKVIQSKQKQGKIHIILDNARYYRSRMVKEFLEKNPRIQLVFLPAYSPNLNIIERLWLVLKKEIIFNKFYEKFKDFKENIISFFQNQAWKKEKYEKFLTDNFHIIKPNFSGF